ncbi:MAG: ABC transporter permease [Clostridia bacterium]|nr:ABC transporter permease [Clostridia bacterium]
MFLRILKKDLKRKKTMNIILVLFVILATMFVSSGLNNVITVSNGTDYYLDKAGIGDYIVITRGENSIGALDDMLSTEKAVKDYRMENVVFGAQDNLSSSDGKKIVLKNMLLIQEYKDTGITYFGHDNEKLPDLQEGHCYITGSFFKKNDMKTGDKLYLEMENVKLELIIDGNGKDALLGSDFMGNTRILISSEDMNKLTSDEKINKYYLGQVCNIDTDDNEAVNSAVSKCSNVSFSDGRSTVKLGYVMDLIVAFITLILSVCLMIVSFVVLKFTITLSIVEEFREIGVMKAIGISNVKIRSLYLGKYLLLAIAGSAVGLIASFPFGKLLINSVSENMVLGNSYGKWPNIIGAVLVVVTIILFAYISTNKVKKVTPLDAIRSGQTGERYSKKTRLKLKNSKASVPSFMAVNDVLSSPKRYFTIVIAFAFCTLFVLILANTVNTMKSERLIGTFSSKADAYVDKISISIDCMVKDKEEILEYLDDTAADIEAMGYPCKAFMDFQYKYPIIADGKEYSISLSQGRNTTMDMYEITEGSIPQSKYEIAITKTVSDIMDVVIGDTVTIDYGTEKIDCTVVAYFESMNNLGKLIRIHEDAPTDPSYISSALQLQIIFTDNPSDEEIHNRIEKLKDYFKTDKIQTATEYQIECLSVVPTMEAVQYLLLAITLIVVILVTILMERSFVSDEKGDIAIMKAIGFKDRKIILWQVLRFGIVAFAAVILAGILSIPITHLCITPIFGMMGATHINYVIDPLKIFLLFPGIIVLLTVVVTFLTSLCTKSIKASDTASIE